MLTYNPEQIKKRIYLLLALSDNHSHENDPLP